MKKPRFTEPQNIVVVSLVGSSWQSLEMPTRSCRRAVEWSHVRSTPRLPDAQAKACGCRPDLADLAIRSPTERPIWKRCNCCPDTHWRWGGRVALIARISLKCGP